MHDYRVIITGSSDAVLEFFTEALVHLDTDSELAVAGRIVRTSRARKNSGSRRRPGRRQLLAGFNTMVTRLDSERTTSNARALQAQEEERAGSRRSWYDEVGQGLTVVLLGLKRLPDQAPPQISSEV